MVRIILRFYWARKFDMVRRLRKVHVFFILVVSFFVLGFPAYFHSWISVGTDVHPTDLSFENPDEDHLPTDHPNELKIAATGGWTRVFFLNGNTSEELAAIPSTRPALDKKTPTLRC